MTTLGFATIVTQIALAWQERDRRRRRHPRAGVSRAVRRSSGFYLFCLALAAFCTWMTANIAHSRFGRALVAIRDAEVAAEAVGISKPLLLVVGVPVRRRAGGDRRRAVRLAAVLHQPDAFTFDLSVLFFIAILIGGRGSILGPLLGTIILTVLPEFAAPLVQWSTFLYAVLLLVIVLVMPGGIADLLDFQAAGRSRAPRDRAAPGAAAGTCSAARRDTMPIVLKDIALSFGGVRAIDGLDLEIRAGRGAWPDRPERQRQDDDAERDLRLLRARSRAA